jgi:hypothetical protein
MGEESSHRLGASFTYGIIFFWGNKRKFEFFDTHRKEKEKVGTIKNGRIE